MGLFMKIRLFSSTSVVIFSLCLFSAANAEQGKRIELASNTVAQAAKLSKVRIVQGEDVLKLADFDEDMVIFDVRSEKERKKGNIRWSESFRLTPVTTTLLHRKIADKKTVIIFYGNNNSSAAVKGAEKTIAQGFKNVYWFKGGWPEWKRKGLKMDM